MLPPLLIVSLATSSTILASTTSSTTLAGPMFLTLLPLKICTILLIAVGAALDIAPPIGTKAPTAYFSTLGFFFIFVIAEAMPPSANLFSNLIPVSPGLLYKEKSGLI